MPASTPFLGLYKPGGGSTGLITPDEVVDIDRLNTNADLIDAFAKSYGPATERNRQLYGPATSLGGVSGMKLGDTYQESDGNKVLWRYDGTNWVTGENGMYLIRPSSVVGGAVNALGYIIPTHGVNGSTTPLSLNSVFTDRFKRYRLEWQYQTVSATGSVFRLRAAGSDYTGADYSVQNINASGNSPGSSRATNVAQAGLAAFSAQDHWGRVDIFSPRQAGAVKAFQGEDSTGVIDHTVTGGALSNSGGKAFVADGLTFALSSSATWVSSGDVSWFKLYGLA